MALVLVCLIVSVNVFELVSGISQLFAIVKLLFVVKMSHDCLVSSVRRHLHLVYHFFLLLETVHVET